MLRRQYKAKTPALQIGQQPIQYFNSLHPIMKEDYVAIFNRIFEIDDG